MFQDENITIVRGLKEEDVSKSIFFYDLLTSSNNKPWLKIIHINLDIYNPKATPSLDMPYQMSPHIYLSGMHQRVNELRNELRLMKIFFSGNQDVSAYGRNIFGAFFNKMNRIEVLNKVRNGLNENQLTYKLPSLELSEYLNKMVLLDWSWSPKEQANLNRRVNNDQWLKQLARTDFFLCPPGIRTPFCHHIIESMAVGTIPILEYSELFDPPLIHLQNAIVFSGGEDLIKKIELVLSLDGLTILELRKGVVAYYDDYLKLSLISEQLSRFDEKRIDLYINGEEKSYTKEMKALT